METTRLVSGKDGSETLASTSTTTSTSDIHPVNTTQPPPYKSVEDASDSLQNHVQKMKKKNKRYCGCCPPSLCKCCVCTWIFLIIAAIVLGSGWACCELWLEAPSADVNTETIAFTGFDIDLSPFPHIVFQAQLTIDVENPNWVGVTITEATVHVWYLDPTNPFPTQQTVYLGQATIPNRKWIGSYSTTNIRLDIRFAGTPMAMASYLNVLRDCAAGSVPLLMNLTDTKVAILEIIEFKIPDIVFEEDAGGCF